MVALALFLTIRVEEPAFGLSSFFIIDILLSCLHDAVVAKEEVGDGVSFQVYDLAASLHFTQLVERIFFSLDRKKLVSFSGGVIWAAFFKIEGKGLVCLMDPLNPFHDPPSLGTFSVAVLSIILIIRNGGGGGVAVCGNLCFRHLHPARLHLPVDEGIIVVADLFVILVFYHPSIGIKIMPAFGGSGTGSVFLQLHPAGLHASVGFTAQVIDGSVDDGLTSGHVAGFVEIIPIFI